MDTTFATWLARTEVADDLVRAFIEQARADPQFPKDVQSIRTLRAYLQDRRANDDTAYGAEEAWAQYCAWSHRKRRYQRQRERRQQTPTE